MSHPDLIIVGAGPAGLALATALARDGTRSLVLEQQPQAAIEQPAEDGRDIALTHRSRRILEALGIWQRLPAQEIAPLVEARVSNGGSPLVLPFDARSDGHEALGWLVPNQRLREAACAAAIEAEGVELRTGVRVTAFERGAGQATLRLEAGAALQAPLVVAADSRHSTLRRMAGIGAQMHDFGRTAIVCRVGHERAHDGVALECFGHGHTLALLPMAGRVSSAVVTLDSDRAPEWLALSDAEFAARIEQRARGRLGAIATAGRRHSYPLVGVYAHRFASERCALVGDAAVGMHPVTAHGYNFGLYGVETLARELAAARSAARPLAAALQAYASEHRRATLPIYLGTNA
ncbi:MAG: 5-demethoxyubiquinol-8 5-hydroxylase UbiM, partial [Burkholderiales bacterium]|nr:5-demethoxyubiquinol-8 5-hydroxylase UbiM [Burkholderiales bacterium]